jgi:hypothetical protein
MDTGWEGAIHRVAVADLDLQLATNWRDPVSSSLCSRGRETGAAPDRLRGAWSASCRLSLVHRPDWVAAMNFCSPSTLWLVLADAEDSVVA